MAPLAKRDRNLAAHTESADNDGTQDSKTFASIFSRSGAVWISKLANREIKAAKARLRALGINTKDPSSEHEDPDFKLG